MSFSSDFKPTLKSFWFVEITVKRGEKNPTFFFGCFAILFLRIKSYLKYSYRVFHRFGQAKFAYVGSILCRLKSIYTTAPAASRNMLSLKVIKIDSKISNSLR